MEDLETVTERLDNRLDNHDPLSRDDVREVASYVAQNEERSLVKKAIVNRHQQALEVFGECFSSNSKLNKRLCSWIDGWWAYKGEAIEFITKNPEPVRKLIGEAPAEEWEEQYVQLRYGRPTDQRLKEFEECFEALFPEHSLTFNEEDKLQAAIEGGVAELVEEVIEEGAEPSFTHLVKALEQGEKEVAQVLLGCFELEHRPDDQIEEILETLNSIDEEVLKDLAPGFPSGLARKSLVRFIDETTFGREIQDCFQTLLPALDQEDYRELQTEIYGNSVYQLDRAYLNHGEEQGYLDDEALFEAFLHCLNGRCRSERVKALYDHGATLTYDLQDRGEEVYSALKSGGRGFKTVDLILCREPDETIETLLQPLFETNLSREDQESLRVLMDRHGHQPPDIGEALKALVGRRFKRKPGQYFLDLLDEVPEQAIAEAYDYLYDRRMSQGVMDSVLILIENDLRPLDRTKFYTDFIDSLKDDASFSDEGLELIEKIYDHGIFPTEAYFEQVESGTDAQQKRARKLFERLPERQRTYLKTADLAPPSPKEETETTEVESS